MQLCMRGDSTRAIFSSTDDLVLLVAILCTATLIFSTAKKSMRYIYLFSVSIHTSCTWVVNIIYLSALWKASAVLKLEHWSSNSFLPAISDRAFVHNFLTVTIISWMASSFLEYTSFVHFTKHYQKFSYTLLEVRWSRSRIVVLLMTLYGTFNSLFLTLILWGAVQRLFENVSRDLFILNSLTFAALMRLLCQITEGLVFIARIVMGDFKWQISNGGELMGRIAFPSLFLLIQSSVLTLKNWENGKYIIFVALCTDILLRLVVCVVATFSTVYFTEVTVVRRAMECLLCLCASCLQYLPRPTTVFLLTGAVNIGFVQFSSCAAFIIIIVIVRVLWHHFLCWQDEQWHIEIDFDILALELAVSPSVQLETEITYNMKFCVLPLPWASIVSIFLKEISHEIIPPDPWSSYQHIIPPCSCNHIMIHYHFHYSVTQRVIHIHSHLIRPSNQLSHSL